MTEIAQMNVTETSDEINILELIGTLLDYKWLIIGITALFTLIGISYVILATPIYQATALIQIEGKKSGIAGLEGIADLTGKESPAITEIEILKSRWIIGKAVDSLNLDVIAQPKRLPFIGNFISRQFSPATAGDVATSPVSYLSQYDWGGADINIFEMKLPDSLLNRPLTLIAGQEGKFSLTDSSGILLLNGEVGKAVESNGIQLQVKSLTANPGMHFIISKRNKFNTIVNFQKRLQAAERGKQSGMVGLSLDDRNAEFAKAVLNELAQLYVQQNVERMSAEAANSLEFLHQQLPQIRLEMEKAESSLNQYQISAKSVNISIETKAVLDQIVSLESSLSDLQLKQIEMDRKFTREHPLYQAMLTQIETLNSTKMNLEEKVKGLPETQQELLRLQRDVEVSSQIYRQLLQKAQELDIARASTVGNARIIDVADVDMSNPVAPKGMLIIAVVTLLGGALSILIAFLHAMLNKGVESPAEIESLDLPVYATIPFSALQVESQKRHDLNKKNMPLLAIEYPTDPSIEAIRSFHTSLHFAMLDAPNNIIMLSGPSPKVGKSYISVNLATLMAQTGKKILLIDADMRKGYIHKFFHGNSSDNGLSTILSKRSEWRNSLTPTNIDGLNVITRGAIPPNPSELLLNNGFAELLHQVAPLYDMILIDTPPILAVADALIVSKLAGTNFIVIRFGANPLAEVRATIKRFETNGIKLKGAILNAVQKKSLSQYSYQKYGYSSYQYNYESDKE